MAQLTPFQGLIKETESERRKLVRDRCDLRLILKKTNYIKRTSQTLKRMIRVLTSQIDSLNIQLKGYRNQIRDQKPAEVRDPMAA